VAAALDVVYREMRLEVDEIDALPVEILEQAAPSARYEVRFAGRPVFAAETLGDLLHHLDNQLTIALERALPELYFLHAAALADASGATLLVGDSGAGKSTTAHALAAAGWDYLSDELAPIELATRTVLPYPRAICLKRAPPAPLVLPAGCLRTEWTLHVPPRALGCRVVTERVPLRRIVFVHYDPARSTPSLRAVSPGEAALRLYQAALNQLVHPFWGVDDTIGLVQSAGCFELLAAGIEETVALLRSSP
jgi:hypothetical protein